MEQENTCETCRYYIQHYAKGRNRYYPVACGHCIFPRIKSRDCYEKACSHYVASAQGGGQASR